MSCEPLKISFSLCLDVAPIKYCVGRERASMAHGQNAASLKALVSTFSRESVILVYLAW